MSDRDERDRVAVLEAVCEEQCKTIARLREAANHALRMLQPPGSPPPTDLPGTLMWTAGEVRDRLEALEAVAEAARALYTLASGDDPAHSSGIRHEGCAEQGEACDVNDALDATREALARLDEAKP